MIRLPPRSKRPYTRFPYTTLLRSVAAMAASPGIGGVDVLQHLLVGRLGHDGADQLLEIGDLGRVTMAGEQVGRDGMIARLGEAAAQVAYPFMHAEYLMHDDDDRRGLGGGGPGEIGRAHV